MTAIAAADGRRARTSIAPTAPVAATRAPATAEAPAIEVRQLRVFVALVEAGGMTAAARTLGVVQSTVSEAIGGLERSLGAPVVVRRSGARGFALTAAGSALLPHARAVLSALELARAEVAAATRESRAVVEVIANESLSTYLLPRVLGLLRERRPNTRFAVTVGTCDDVRAGLAAGRFDVGLSFETAPRARRAQAGLGAAQVLAEVPLLLFARAGHALLARGQDTLRADLGRATVFTCDAAGDFHELLRRFFARSSPGVHLEAAGSVEAVKRSVVRDRRALGVLPAYALGEELRSGVLGALRLRPAPPRVRLEARASVVRAPSPGAHELIAALQDIAAGATERPRRERAGG